jgi:hypothetical protein
MENPKTLDRSHQVNSQEIRTIKYPTNNAEMGYGWDLG